MRAQEHNYCRLCAELTPAGLLIIADNNSEIVKKLQLLNIDILTVSALPTTICFICCDSLDGTWNFLQKVIAAQQKLNVLFDQVPDENNGTPEGMDSKNDLNLTHSNNTIFDEHTTGEKDDIREKNYSENSLNVADSDFIVVKNDPEANDFIVVKNYPEANPCPRIPLDLNRIISNSPWNRQKLNNSFDKQTTQINNDTTKEINSENVINVADSEFIVIKNDPEANLHTTKQTTQKNNDTTKEINSENVINVADSEFIVIKNDPEANLHTGVLNDPSPFIIMMDSDCNNDCQDMELQNNDCQNKKWQDTESQANEDQADVCQSNENQAKVCRDANIANLFTGVPLDPNPLIIKADSDSDNYCQADECQTDNSQDNDSNKTNPNANLLPAAPLDTDKWIINFESDSDSDCHTNEPDKSNLKERELRKVIRSPSKRTKRKKRMFNKVEPLSKDSPSFTWHNYKCRCAVCNLLCENITSLRQHSIDSHRFCLIFKCAEPNCEKVIYDFKSIISHGQKHNKLLRHCCCYCQKYFVKASHIKKHLETHHADARSRSCHHCGAFFKSVKLLQEHIASYDEYINEIKKRLSVYKCDECDRVFNRQARYTVHKKLHKKRGSDFICKTCGKKFVMKLHLIEHRITHKSATRKRRANTQKPLKCEYCQAVFKGNGNLQSHMKTHGFSRFKW